MLEVEADDTAPGQRAADRLREDDSRRAARNKPRPRWSEALDAVVTNVVLMDPVLGIRKTSIGIRDGRIDRPRPGRQSRTMDGVSVPISAATGIIPGEGLIATPGVSIRTST